MVKNLDSLQTTSNHGQLALGEGGNRSHRLGAWLMSQLMIPPSSLEPGRSSVRMHGHVIFAYVYSHTSSICRKASAVNDQSPGAFVRALIETTQVPWKSDHIIAQLLFARPHVILLRAS